MRKESMGAYVLMVALTIGLWVLLHFCGFEYMILGGLALILGALYKLDIKE